MPTKNSDIQVHINGPLTDAAKNRLTAIREKHGLSYEKLGKLIGFSQAFTYNLLNKNANFHSMHLDKVTHGIKKAEEDGVLNGVANDGVAMLKHAFHLRQNLEIQLNLPVDFTGHEAVRLAKFVSSLPVQ